MDIYTLSNYFDVSVKHMSMNLKLDMEGKKFSGFVDLHIENPRNSPKLTLDSKSLNIISTKILDTHNAFQTVNFELQPANDDVRGCALHIPIKVDTKVVRVEYQTTDKANGLDWINLELTKDGFPMVVTQFQAINARTFVPCQDTPAQRVTYDATIELASDVADPRMQVIMAAMERVNHGNGKFSFRMTKSIPTYLIALAAGVFAEKAISHRVKVIAEPSMVDVAAEEFADAERMVAAAEELFGPYDWERFDIFIMPPSFSYGGMENPTMTFIGPTVIAGDKSLVDVIAHELAHSWSGNKVTNASWNDFWINEGTTMYIQRLIVEKLYGEDEKQLDIVLGQQVLRDNIAHIAKDPHQGPALTKLKLDLAHDFDPDDAVSHVPYEKGFNFWLALEQAYGANTVLAFLNQYFTDHAFTTMNTSRLRELIISFPDFAGATKVDMDNWFHGEGLPASDLPKVDSEFMHAVDEAVKALKNRRELSAADSFNTKQWSYFLKSAISVDRDTAIKLERQFNLSHKNDEVRSDFFAFAIRSNAFLDYRDSIDRYLTNVGRMKYVKPIYEALIDAGRRTDAQAFFKKHQHHNNLITRGAIERCLRE